MLGHFVAEQHLPGYERSVGAGSWLVVVHGAEQGVARAEQILVDAAGGGDVRRHDQYRGSTPGPVVEVGEVT